MPLPAYLTSTLLNGIIIKPKVMKNLKKLFVIVLGVSAVQYAQAQSAKMSEPVGYRLGNGMNIIISENSRSPKAYSSFTLDAKAFEGKKME